MAKILQVHPSIQREVGLLDRSVEMAESAFAQSDGEMEAKFCNVKLGAARVLQGAARIGIQARLIAGKLAIQESKVINQNAT